MMLSYSPLCFSILTKMFYNHFFRFFIHEAFFFSHAPASNLFLFLTHTKPCVCQFNVRCALDPTEMNWWTLHLCGRNDKLFFPVLLSSDETHLHILWHKFRPNKIFCTLTKHIFMLYKYFRLNFESNEENLCQTMINFYNISCWETIFEGSFEEANKWIIKVSLVLEKKDTNSIFFPAATAANSMCTCQV